MTATEPGHDSLAAQNFPAATLYVVATPIGNLGDITLRALECLRRVDAVAAEDTRMARRLLTHHGIDKPCFAAHRHNERSAGAVIAGRVAAGERIAYLSDAGTPGISDPGAKLVGAVRAAGLRVVPIPGVSALTCALSVAGLPEGPFHFVGFLPAKAAPAEEMLRSLANLAANLVFYEAPHRVRDSVALMARVLGGQRHVAIARELTKLFEEVHVCMLGEAEAWLNADANRQRGEFVLAVEGRHAPADPLEQALPLLQRLLRELPLSRAVELAAELSGTSRKALYAKALEMKARE